MDLSDAARSVWAKHDEKAQSRMLLTTHMRDSAEVARRVWGEWVPEQVRRVVVDAVGDERSALSLVSFLACGHDVGKSSPAFAVQVPELASRMRDEGLVAAAGLLQRPERRRVRHEVVSQLALQRWLESRGWEYDVARTFATVLGAHHGSPPSPALLGFARTHPDLLGRGLWEQVRDELLDHALDLTGAEEHLSDWSSRPLPIPAQVVLSSVVIVADWIASSAEHFPYGQVTPDRWDEGWVALDLPGPWQPPRPPGVEQQVSSRFSLPAGAEPRPVQRAAVAAAWEMPGPGLLVIEAEMGSGKTEAAFAAAEVLAHRFGAGGLFLALPTMATSDAMFGRVLRWLERLPRDADTDAFTMFLAHGRAALNPDAASLWRVAPTAVGDDGEHLGAVIAHEWLRGRKRGVLSSFVVGTIDQVLFGALKSKHLVLRHLALAGKVVVVDECHAADDFSRAYLERVLHWLGAYRAPVVLLSATLPAAQRRQLVEAYEDGRRSGRSDGSGGDDGTAPSTGDAEGSSYPLLTWTTGDDRGRVAIGASGAPRAVRVETCDDSDEALLALLRDALAEGGCAGVVRNTVARAQQTARVLREELGEDVVLLHSRFVAPDRADRERDLVARLGPPGEQTDRPRRLVVVGTQVIEQSLDIDLDLLVTDLAPVDLLLQRCGRLHRHPGRAPADRPARLREARCVLVGVESWTSVPPRFPRGSLAVYGRSRLLRAAGVLQPALCSGSVTLPDDIAPLVQDAYADDPPVPASWSEAAADADALHARWVADQLARAETWRLGPVTTADDPLDAPDLSTWALDSVGDVDEARSSASVRDAEDTLEVVVVQRVGGEVRVLPWATDRRGSVVDPFLTPPNDIAKAVATCTLRLPLQLTRGAAGDALVDHLERANHFSGWQGSWWLSGQLVLVLDENQRAAVPGADLHYDLTDGLTITTTEAA